MSREARIVALVVSGAWALFSLAFRCTLEDNPNPWWKALVLLGLFLALPVFIRLCIEEGRDRERRSRR